MPEFRAIQFAQRDGGHAHLVSVGARQEAQPEDLKSVARGHAVHILVDGADQHLPPEALDGARRLALFAQPVEHGDAVQIVAPGALAPQRQQSARDGQLVGGVQEPQPQERSGEMQRSGQRAAAQRGNAAAGLDEVKLAIEADAVPHAQPPVEIQQVDAAAQQHVLAVVDQLGSVVGRRERKRSRAAAQKRARFEHLDAEPGAAQRRRRREPGQSAAYDDRARHLPS